MKRLSLRGIFRNSFRACRGSGDKLPKRLLLIAAFLLFALCAGTLNAVEPIVVDDWQRSTDLATTTEGDGEEALSLASTRQANPGDLILGDFRNIYLERSSDESNVTFLSVTGLRTAEIISGANAAATVRLFWDGGARYDTDPDNEERDGPDPLILDGQNDLDATSVIDPRGLDGISLDGTCAEGARRGLYLLFEPTDTGEMVITADIFSERSKWSRATNVIGEGDNPQIIGFYFEPEDPQAPEDNEFQAQGSDPAGAEFSDIGAIVLSFEGDVASDVDWGTPLFVSCGADFGDAPQGGEAVSDFETGEIVQLSLFTYRTLAAETDNVIEDAPVTPCVDGDPDGACGAPTNQALENSEDPLSSSVRGPFHTIGGPFLGLGQNDTDSEPDGQPDDEAQGDLGDEEALQTPPVFYADFVVQGDVNPLPGEAEFAECAGVEMDENEYCVALEASNPTDRWAQVVGWIDFRGSGSFDNLCAGSVSGVVEYEDLVNLTGNFCERSAATIRIGELDGNGLRDAGESPEGSCDHTGLEVGADLNDGTNWSSGNMPPGCEGVVVLTWDLNDVVQAEVVADSEDGAILTTDATFARFRITTDDFEDSNESGFFTASGPTPFGYASDGEVEDHMIEPDTLPVSISSFDSQYTREGLEVSWTTVSETENVGFHVWGDTGSGMELLVDEIIPSEAQDLANPTEYQVIVPDVRRGSLQDVAITAVDNRGNEELYGLYDVGEAYGRKSLAEPVDWASVREQTDRRLVELRVETRPGGLLAHQDSGNVRAVDFAAVEAGMQRVTYEDLVASGLDLEGVPVSDIAVTLKGRAVPRLVSMPDADSGRSLFGGGARFRGDEPESGFGPGGVIKFWGEKPVLPDALYVEDYVYRVKVDSSRAVASNEYRGRPGRDTVRHSRLTEVVDEDVYYNVSNPNPDPFFAQNLRAGTNLDTYSTSVHVGANALLHEPATLRVRVAGETRTGANPDHHVRVSVNGQTLKDDYFNGRVSHVVEAEIPPNLLQAGQNTVVVEAPGGTDNPIDFMFVDTVAIEYSRESVAENNVVVIESVETSAGESIGARGFLGAQFVGFAWDGETLWKLDAQAVGRGEARVPSVRGVDDAEYWISTPDAVHEPEFVRAVGPNTLLDGPGETDLVVIAHPAFMPASRMERHPANNYLGYRSSQGWSPEVFDILEIQNQYGGGMPLPGAVNRFLQDANQVYKFEHVLLVGDGNYDHLDKLGLGGISFIPSPYRATSRIRHTPADTLMADLTGDGLGDKAVGRWPVRTLDDLAATVAKTIAWETNTRQQKGAVWLTGRQDPSTSSFGGQIQRMASPLINSGWPEDDLNLIVFEEVGGADAVRAQMISALEEGRALAGFSGHAAPNMWSFDGVLAPEDVALIDNVGLPTMIGTLSCYTSYAASPFSNTIAHRMMNGYMLDQNGDPIPGAANGAAAIHGAATLSSLAQNETFARKVLEGQLEGLTVGEAIQAARRHATARDMRDQALNWTLLGDPTMRLVESGTTRSSRASR